MSDLHNALLKHNAQVPRYTSYPTAPHFKAADVSAHATALQELDANVAVSLYVHVPFCREMCWYCGCNTSATRKYAPVEDYISLLLREIHIVRDVAGKRLPVSHVHFGGGSPSMLSPEDFLRLMDAIRENFAFANEAEIAIEADPRGITYDRAQAYARAGVNRGSFGIQDFSPVVQAAINRMQPLALVERAVGLFRQFGINDINFDLMYGLPLQTCDDVANTIEKSLQLSPQRIAMFGYAHVPWMKKHMRLIKDEDLPDAAERLKQFALAEKMLTTAGLQAVGIDHFVRSDDDMCRARDARQLMRNFQGYTTDRATTLIGLGASSISRMPDGFAQNAVTVTEYSQAVLDGKLAVAKSCALTQEDRLRADIISDLMCYLECNLQEKLEVHGYPADYFDTALSGMEDLATDGLISCTGRTIGVCPDARQAARVVAARFDAYLGAGVKRHAQVA